MFICLEKNCTWCLIQHRFLKCLKKGQNEEAKSILQLQELGNLRALRDSTKSTLLHYAVQYGNAEMTEHLIARECDVNAPDESGITPLMIAVNLGDLKITEILLKNNADVYFPDSGGKTSLQFAFKERLHESSLEPFKRNSHLILERLLDIVNDDFSRGKLTQFLTNANDFVKMAVVILGGLEITKFVLKNGYSMNYCEPEGGYTALHCAILLGRVGNAKLLIEYGAKVDSKDNRGHSLLRGYTLNFEDVDENSKVLKIILELSTSLSSRINRITDVEYLLKFGKKKTVKTILLSGIDVNQFINKNKSLGFILLDNTDAEVLDLFTELNINVEVNRCKHRGRTALMTAAALGCLKKVQFLLQRGAEVNVVDRYGKSALFYVHKRNTTRHSAEESNAAKVTELLLQYGADVQTFCNDEPHLLDRFSLSIKVIIAHLAMLGVLHFLTHSSRSAIKSKLEIKNYFNSCTKQIYEMKQFVVNGTVTLFKLMIYREESIMAYVRNQELISTWSCAMKNLTHLEAYYLNILKGRLTRLSDEAKLQEEAALAIGALTGLCSDVYNAIVFQIINYLNRKDLYNLCAIYNNLS